MFLTLQALRILNFNQKMMMTLILKNLPKTARPQPRGKGIPSGVPFMCVNRWRIP